MGAAIQPVPLAEIANWIGHEFVSDWTLIDQDRINRYADVVRDYGWVHVDVERARDLRGGTIAHGMLTLDLLPGLANTLYEITGIAHGLNYGLNDVRFTGIVRTDTRVRVRITIAGAKPRGDGTLITTRFVFEREGETQPACVGEQLFVMFPAQAAAKSA